MYSREECLPENWKNCYTDVQYLFACFHLSSVWELGSTHDILPGQAVWEGLAVAHEGSRGERKGVIFAEL